MVSVRWIAVLECVQVVLSPVSVLMSVIMTV